jgi:riboflavin synthase
VYSGITRGLFPVVSVDKRPGLLRYSVELSDELAAGLGCGASVSIDGVCQTVVAVADRRITFEAAAETLARTTLDALGEGRAVSVERSCRAGDELGGHDVFGHVIGTGTILGRAWTGAQLDLTIGVPEGWVKYILPKGFIAVDGSSRTVGEVRAEGAFEVHLVPETLRVTGLGAKAVGDRVNIELDARTVAIVQTVERVLRERDVERRAG